MGKIIIKKIINFISVLWFLFVSIISPVWTGCIYMYITGHGKGYAYDLGTETDISVLMGIVMLMLWLLAILPVTALLCKKCHKKNPAAFACIYSIVCYRDLYYRLERIR